jgi:hypothetical protein
LARVRKLRKSLEKNSMAEMTGEEGARGRWQGGPRGRRKWVGEVSRIPGGWFQREKPEDRLSKFGAQFNSLWSLITSAGAALVEWEGLVLERREEICRNRVSVFSHLIYPPHGQEDFGKLFKPSKHLFFKYENGEVC